MQCCLCVDLSTRQFAEPAMVKLRTTTTVQFHTPPLAATAHHPSQVRRLQAKVHVHPGNMQTMDLCQAHESHEVIAGFYLCSALEWFEHIAFQFTQALIAFE